MDADHQALNNYIELSMREFGHGHRPSTNILPMIGSNKTSLSRMEVATALGVSKQTVERFINRGELPAFKVGTQWRIRQIDLDAFMESRVKEQRERTGGAE
jgi:excisionase family DNA binding protein